MKIFSSYPRRRAVRRIAGILAFMAIMAVSLPATGWAQSLADLRAQGVVGERYDGMAVVRTSGGSADVQKFVADVNAKRQKIYAERSAQQKVPIGQVGRVYAKQIYAELPAGSWFLDESGTWRRK